MQKMRGNETVAIVIATYNRKDYLKDLIDSIRKMSYKDFHIIVVNNSSTDGTQEWLEQQQDITTITQVNSGGAGAFFTGLKYAAEKGYHYTWIMDDDVLVYSDSLLNLVKKANQLKDNFGYLCSKVIDNNNRPCNVPSVNMKKNDTGDVEWNELCEFNLIKVLQASFVSVFFPIKRVIEMGLPYKEFFIWGDDSEYTSRMSKEFDCYLVTDSIVQHRRLSAGILSLAREKDSKRKKNYFYLYRNSLFISKKYKGKLYLCYRYSRAILECLLYLCTFQFSNASIVFRGIMASLFFKPVVVFPCQSK